MVAEKIIGDFQFLIPQNYGSQIFSSCLECGTGLSLATDTVVYNHAAVIMCDECYQNHTWTQFKLNAEFSTGHPCLACGSVIDFNSNFCPYCAMEMKPEDWNEYVAYLLDLGEYNGLTSQSGFSLLEHRIFGSQKSYRAKYDNDLQILQEICFLCLEQKYECTCVYNLTMNRINTLPIPDLKGIYYELNYADPDEVAKKPLTCTDCKWQYTNNCKPLALELLDVDIERYRRDHKVVIENELVSCEYMSEDDSWGDGYTPYF